MRKSAVTPTEPTSPGLRNRLGLIGIGLAAVVIGALVIGSSLRKLEEIRATTGETFVGGTEYTTTTWNDGTLQHTTVHATKREPPPNPTRFQTIFGAILLVGGFGILLHAAGLKLTLRR